MGVKTAKIVNLKSGLKAMGRKKNLTVITAKIVLLRRNILKLLQHVVLPISRVKWSHSIRCKLIKNTPFIKPSTTPLSGLIII